MRARTHTHTHTARRMLVTLLLGCGSPPHSFTIGLAATTASRTDLAPDVLICRWQARP